MGIAKIVEYYLISDKPTGITISGNTWSESVPTMTEAKPYLWNYEKIVYDDDTTNPSTQNTVPCVIGHYGANGKNGRGILKIEELYLATSLASVTTSTSGWSNKPSTQVISVDKPYLWNYEKITYTDGDVESTDPVIIGVFGVTSQNDVSFLADVFGETNVDAQKGALVRTLVGVTSTSDTTKVVTMINASDVGYNSTHGRLFIAAGMNGISTDAGIAAAKFKVYEDGTTEVKDLVATNADISGKITAVSGTIGPFSIDEYTSMSSKFVSGDLTGKLDLCGGYIGFNILDSSSNSTNSIIVGLKSTSQQALIDINVSADRTDRYGLRIAGATQDSIIGIRLENAGIDLMESSISCDGHSNIYLYNGAFISLSAESSIKHFKTEFDSGGSITLNAAYHHTYVVTSTGSTVTLPSSPAGGDEFDIIVAVSGRCTLDLNDKNATVLSSGTVGSYADSVYLEAGSHNRIWYTGTKWIVVKS